MAGFRFKTTAAERAETERELAQEPYRRIEAEERDVRLSAFLPAEGVERIRRKFGKTQTEMAAIAEVSRRALQSYERGEKSVPGSVLYRISAYFDVDLHELTTGRRSPIDSQTQAELQRDAIKAFRALVTHFRGTAMTADEMATIAGQMLKWLRPGDGVDAELMEAATRAVTGDKYISASYWEPFGGGEEDLALPPCPQPGSSSS